MSPDFTILFFPQLLLALNPKPTQPGLLIPPRSRSKAASKQGTPLPTRTGSAGE